MEEHLPLINEAGAHWGIRKRWAINMWYRTMSHMALRATELRPAKILYANKAGDEYGEDANKLSDPCIARFDAHAHGFEGASSEQDSEDVVQKRPYDVDPHGAGDAPRQGEEQGEAVQAVGEDTDVRGAGGYIGRVAHGHPDVCLR